MTLISQPGRWERCLTMGRAIDRLVDGEAWARAHPSSGARGVPRVPGRGLGR